MSRKQGNLKNRITNTFDSFSSWYDDKHGRWMKYSTNMVLNELMIPVNPVCLDVACGTGLSTFELMKSCNGKGKFYGIDISQKMIELANNIVNENGLNNVKFQLGDVENIEFPDSTFDLVLSNMSLPFFPDKRKALYEMHRVLKPGGQFALTYNGGPNFKEGIEVAFRVAADHLEVPLFHDAVMDSKNMFIDLEESMDLFETVGLQTTNIYGRHGITFAEPTILTSEYNTLWDIWRQSIPEDQINNIGSSLEKTARKAATEKGLKYTTYVIFAWGIKPINEEA